MQGEVFPAEEVRPFEHLRIVNHDEVVAMEHRTGIGEADEARAGGCARQIDLVPRVPAQSSDLLDLDAAKTGERLRIRRHQNLPLRIQELLCRLAAREQAVHRFDDLGGIALHACQRLCQEPAVDGEFQSRSFSLRVSCADNASRLGIRAEWWVDMISSTCSAIVRASSQADSMRGCMMPSCFLHISMRLHGQASIDDVVIVKTLPLVSWSGIAFAE